MTGKVGVRTTPVSWVSWRGGRWVGSADLSVRTQGSWEQESPRSTDCLVRQDLCSQQRLSRDGPPLLLPGNLGISSLDVVPVETEDETGTPTPVMTVLDSLED